jgi:mannose-6-phosphate isomerase
MGVGQWGKAARAREGGIGVSAYPLVFEPMLFEKVWGGRRLERFGKVLPPGKQIGESWEVADMAATSASGAGGGAARSVIANGPLKGRTLHEALNTWDVLGDPARSRAAAETGFPLLVKYLDARENLSVQVHPSPAYTSAHKDAHLKTECWYILAAEPGSVIYKGVRPGITRDDLARRIAEGTVADALVAVPAIAGEMHNLPSGTIHALGAGVLVAEIQTPSDTTFRVFDWGRVGRELHIGPSLECIDLGPAPAATRGSGGQATLVASPFYTVDELNLACERRPVGSGCCVLMVLSGMGGLFSRDGSFEEVPFRAGTTMLVPASCAASAMLAAGPDTRILRATV